MWPLYDWLAGSPWAFSAGHWVCLVTSSHCSHQVLDASTLSYSTRVKWFVICFAGGILCSILVSVFVRQNWCFCVLFAFILTKGMWRRHFFFPPLLPKQFPLLLQQISTINSYCHLYLSNPHRLHKSYLSVCSLAEEKEETCCQQFEATAIFRTHCKMQGLFIGGNIHSYHNRCRKSSGMKTRNI